MSAFSAGSIQAWEKHRTRINTGRVKRQEVPVSRLGSFAARHEEAIAFPLTSALVGSSFSPCAGRPPLLLLRADGGGGGGCVEGLCHRGDVASDPSSAVPHGLTSSKFLNLL